jgi:hypothetical protein
MKHDDIDTRSPLLPTDPFDQALARLTGLPNGASTVPTVVQSTDYYGKTTSFMVQTVKYDEGETVFITEVTGTGGARRFVIPPKVLATVLRQRDSLSTMIRRRHGRRLAEERKAAGVVTTFTPEMRRKALVSRKKKAAARRARVGK